MGTGRVMGTASWDNRFNTGPRLTPAGGHGIAEPIRPEPRRVWADADFAAFNEGVERAREAYQRRAKS